ncbi:MAG: TonB-dependent receptor [Gemmatimonadetes bacterium]|nr:TonB-dependent receptor [Gemmatimonadota bacterium]
MNRRTVVAPLAGLLVVLAISGDVRAQSASGTLAGPVAPGDSAMATLTGSVRGRFADRVRPLAGAFVDIRTPHRRFLVETDDEGRYLAEGLPPGQLAVRVAHPGHRAVSMTVRATAGRTLRVDLELTATPISVEGIDVSSRVAQALAGLGAASSAEGLGLSTDPELEVKLLEISPSLGESGIADAVQNLPGYDPSDPTDVLFMRGSTTDLKLVLLDGVPVYTPFHVAGLLRSFEPTVLGGADLHVGGAPARYDGGLTHILDLRTRSPRRDRVRVTGAVDLLSASTAAEIPLGSKAGLLASARTLHDLGRTPLGGERPYGYGDLLLRADAEPAEGHRLRATGFQNGESVRLDFGTGRSDAEWSNEAASAAYEGRIGRADLRISAGGSRYHATLPLQPTATSSEPDPSPILASAFSERRRVDADVAWGSPGAAWRTGASAEFLEASFHAESLDDSQESRSAGSTLAAGVFLETTRRLGPALTGRFGLRADGYSGSSPRLSPRAALMWELSPEAVLSVAVGRYHQVTRTPDSRVDETLEAFANDRTTPDELLPVATADHVVVSLDQRLGASVSLGVQGFWKRFEGLAGAVDDGVRSSGLDIRVLNAGDEGAVWIGYGLSWFWSPTDFSGASTDFAGRHLLSAGISGPLWGRIRGEGRLAYGAGLPSTSIPFGSATEELASPALPGGETLADTAPRAPLPQLDESFVRIDLEVHAVFEPGWRGGDWRVRPYLRLLNALDRRDALFYAYQPWRPDSVTPLAERPILPVLGIAFSF